MSGASPSPRVASPSSAPSPFATADGAEFTTLPPALPPVAAPAFSRDTAFSAIADEYRALFDACLPDPARDAQIDAQLRKMRPGEMRYHALGVQLGVPWIFIAIIHSLECASNFTLHLHNGDPLSARTLHVPSGRPADGQPPFTWEASAEDALRMKGYVGQSNWSLAAMLFRWETYNGMGYRVRGLPSPYLWSFSNLYSSGLFVTDHVFDADAVSRQCGAAVLLKRLTTT
jgi:lysozyme family protein